MSCYIRQLELNGVYVPRTRTVSDTVQGSRYFFTMEKYFSMDYPVLIKLLDDFIMEVSL